MSAIKMKGEKDAHSKGESEVEVQTEHWSKCIESDAHTEGELKFIIEKKLSWVLFIKKGGGERICVWTKVKVNVVWFCIYWKVICLAIYRVTINGK